MIHSLGRISGTDHRAENIDNTPAMMQASTMKTFKGKLNLNILVVETKSNFTKHMKKF